MTSRTATFAAIFALLMTQSPSNAITSARPTRPGTCAFTTINVVGQRLEDGKTHRTIPSSGSQVSYANGILGVSYDQVAALNASRRGDRVMLCLVKLPRNCPPHDERGKLYTATNLRTDQSWTLPDAEHQCGGA